jgi:hypothetical protein
MLRTVCIAMAVVMVEATIYAVVIRYNPFALLSFVCTLIFGVAIGVEVSRVWYSRTRTFRLTAALLLAILGLWTHWLVWIALTVQHGAKASLHLVWSSPLHWAQFLDRLAHTYHFVLMRKNGAPAPPSSPLALECVWLGEASLIFAIAAFASINTTGEPVYNKWTIEVWAGGLSSKMLREAFARGDVAPLYSRVWHDALTKPPQLPAWKGVEFTFDNEHNAISAVMVDHRPVDTQGLPQRRTPLVESLSLPRRDYRALVNHLSRNIVIKD